MVSSPNGIGKPGGGGLTDDAEAIERQLGDRRGDTVASLKAPPDAARLLVHTVHSDMGVARNGGRRGAALGARAVLAAFGRLAAPARGGVPWGEEAAAPADFDALPFEEAQRREAERIRCDPGKAHVHLGGGHDHVLPLLTSLQSWGRPLHALNVDAHLDTRTDPLPHSGTPFRQFAAAARVPFRLTQVGILPAANPESSRSPLPGGARMDVAGPGDPGAVAFDPEEATVFSLDCDALAGLLFPAVSAVNPEGLQAGRLHVLWEAYRAAVPHPPVVGVYEYNPLFDGPGAPCARFLAAFLHRVAFGGGVR